MRTTMPGIIGSLIFGDRFLSVYKEMAETFTADSIEQLHSEIRSRQAPLSFPEINSRVAAFNNELINRATWIREDYKENKGYSSPKLTRGCKKVIGKCVDDYLRALHIASRKFL